MKKYPTRSLPHDQCVYSIWNTVNARRYIGCTTNFKKRVGQHLCQLKGGKHPAEKLQDDWIDFDEELFCFEILEIDEDVDFRELRQLEDVWIEKYDCYGTGYNNLPKRLRDVRMINFIDRTEE